MPGIQPRSDPEKVKDMDDTIRRLQNFRTITPEQIERFNKERRQTRRFNCIPILSQLTEEQAAKFLFSSII